MIERVRITHKKPKTKKENAISQIRKTESLKSISPPVDRVLFLQRTIGNQAVQRMIRSRALQTKLRIDKPVGIYEQEADRVAEQVMKIPEVSEKLTKDAGTSIPILGEEQIVDICPKSCSNHDTTNPLIPKDTEARINAISGGRHFPESVRAFFEPRFGYDFSRVRFHTDAKAAESTRAMNALAYTVGNNVVFGAREYSPETESGKRLIAHELVHVVQQRAGGGDRFKHAVGSNEKLVQRQIDTHNDPLDDPRMHPEGAPKAASCAPPSWCPKTFCQPYSSESYAKHMRTKMMLTLMAGIAIAVDSRVVPLWHEHLLGGSAPKDLTSQFGSDFTSSKTTEKTTDFLVDSLKKSLQGTPPTFPPKTDTVTVDIPSRIGSEIKEIDTPGNSHEMNFNIPKEVPGNIAGGVGKDQLTCKAGANPSPFNDERTAEGTAKITRDASGNLSVEPSITYTVKDTIDLCPGDCGTALEQIATVPISQFEATGISGDIPFTVKFPAKTRHFTILAKGSSKP